MEEDFSNTTDVADYLVARGVPFGEAYRWLELWFDAVSNKLFAARFKSEAWKELHQPSHNLHDALAPRAVVAARRSEGAPV